MIIKASRLADLLERGKQDDQLEREGNEESEVQDPINIIPCPDIKSLRESNEAAVNLRLGTWFMSLRQGRTSHLPVYEQADEAQLTKSLYVPFGKEYFLHPRCFVLGVTLEWIQLPSFLAGYVIGKSSWGRRGLIIATATGVHPGFTGCLTLELSNIGEVPIAIRPGMPICQLFLHQCEADSKSSRHRSQFAGRRKPTLGTIHTDRLGDQLAKQ